MVTCVSTAGPSDGLIAGFLFYALHSMFTCNCNKGINLETGVAAAAFLRPHGRLEIFVSTTRGRK